jgi:tetratricopeptide (TPR) repeat protein
MLVPLMVVCAASSFTQNSSQSVPGSASIQGMVRDSAGRSVAGASVRLEKVDATVIAEAKTSDSGSFELTGIPAGTFVLLAQASNPRIQSSAVVSTKLHETAKVDVVLDSTAAREPVTRSTVPNSTESMEFSDAPNFKIAGVTDWTAAGGHGSDTVLRTSEAITRQVTAVDPKTERAHATQSTADGCAESERRLHAAVLANPASFDANRLMGEFYLKAARRNESIPFLQAAASINPGDNAVELDLADALREGGDLRGAQAHVQRLLARQPTAELHRMNGEISEGLGDSLIAVREFELAARMDPSELNIFRWGSELLLHRAVWQAKDVLSKGIAEYPKSERMMIALGAALFSGALYDEAAAQLCKASDLNPTNRDPYILMGKIEVAAPEPLVCVEHELARFVEQNPSDPLANYYYAMALWKRNRASLDTQAMTKIKGLLTKAVALDPKCADALLQLGNLSVSDHDYLKAIEYYSQAIAADSELIESHYRLGMAYDRVGEQQKARQEFQLYDELKKRQAAIIEHQRQQVKQFLVVGPADSENVVVR